MQLQFNGNDNSMGMTIQMGMTTQLGMTIQMAGQWQRQFNGNDNSVHFKWQQWQFNGNDNSNGSSMVMTMAIQWQQQFNGDDNGSSEALKKGNCSSMQLHLYGTDISNNSSVAMAMAIQCNGSSMAMIIQMAVLWQWQQQFNGNDNGSSVGLTHLFSLYNICRILRDGWCPRLQAIEWQS